MMCGSPSASKPSKRPLIFEMPNWHFKAVRDSQCFSRCRGGESAAGMRSLRHAGRGARHRLHSAALHSGHACAAPVAPSLTFLLRVPHRHGGRGRQTADADSLLMRPPRRCSQLVCVPVRVLVRERLFWYAAACHAVRGRSLRSLRPSRHARLPCFADVAGVRSSMRLSGPQPAPPPARWRVPASKLARSSGPPLFVTPPAGVSAGQPSRQPGAARHAACGGLTAPPYRSLRSLGGADAPGSGLRPARPGAGLAPRGRWLSVVRDSSPSQAMRRANGRPAGRCARPSSRRTAWDLPCGELRPCWLVVVRGAVSGGALRLTPTAASPPRPET